MTWPDHSPTLVNSIFPCCTHTHTRARACSIIERHPIIMRDPEPWEADYFAMQEEIMQHGKVRDVIESQSDPTVV